MAKGHITKESWSRCQEPSMLYDVTLRRPGGPLGVPKQPTGSPCFDSIEISQSHLNKQMVNRFKNVGLQLPHESFVAVVQVGKYVFLAIMLPPYLLLYGVPRWMFQTMMPTVIDFSQAAAMKVGKFVYQLSKHVTDLMKGVLDQLLGDAMRMTKHQAKNMMKRLREMGKKVSHVIAENMAKIQKWQHHLQKAFKKFSIGLFGKVRTTFKDVRNYSKEVAKKVAEYVVKAAHIADKYVLTPVIAKVLIPCQIIGKGIKATTKFIVKISKKVKAQVMRVAQPVVAKISEAATVVAYFVKKHVVKVTDPIVAWVGAGMKAIADVGGKVWKAVAHPIIKVVAVGAEKVKQTVVASYASIKGMLSPLPSIALNALRWTWGLLPQRYREKMPWRKEMLQQWAGLAKRFSQGIVSGVTFAGKGCKRVAVVTLKKMKASWKWLSKFFRMVGGYMSDFGRFVFRGMKVAAKSTGVVLKQIAFALQLFVAVIWAMCYFGFLLLRQFAR